MSEPKQCPSCGHPVGQQGGEHGGLQGLCPACLLRRAGEQPEPAAGDDLPDPERVRRAFPELEILELLGRGGMGVVYKARQRRLDRLVAVKVLAPRLSSDPAFVERFVREARVLARLNHPNVVAVHDFGEAEGICYLTMEYVDGNGLRDRMGMGGMLPGEALAIVPQICAGLQYAHDQGVVHRDIKPENILIDRGGRVKIADFGLAKLLDRKPGDATLTRTDQIMGTPHYMAPEQMRHSRVVDHRADLYSLGVVLYEMLTAELPIGRFEPPSRQVELDGRVDDVVLKALEQEPERRYQQADQLRSDVEGISRPGSGAARAEPPAADDGLVELTWLGRVPGGALVVSGAALAISQLWIWWWAVQTDRPDHDLLAVAYPLAFVGFLAASAERRAGSFSLGRLVLSLCAAFTCMQLVVGMSRTPHGTMMQLVLECLAAVLVVCGHLFLDRALRGLRLQPFVAFAFFLLTAATLHASAASSGRAREGMYFLVGFLGLLACSNAMALIPEYSARHVGRHTHQSLSLSFGLAAVGALFYFNRYLF